MDVRPYQNLKVQNLIPASWQRFLEWGQVLTLDISMSKGSNLKLCPESSPDSFFYER